MTLVCTQEHIARVLSSAAERFESGRHELCALDAVAGDGDLGVTMETGFRAAADAFASSTNENVGAGLRAAGLAFNRVAPSTLGTLMAGALIEAGRTAGSSAALDSDAVARLLRAAVDAISKRGKASPGDKTVLDALAPGVDALDAALQEGKTLREAVDAAAAAAVAGVEATRTMAPRAGRARWMASRSAGNPDAGATAAAWFFESWATGNN